jgi:hypothetical protein
MKKYIDSLELYASVDISSDSDENFALDGDIEAMLDEIQSDVADIRIDLENISGLTEIDEITKKINYILKKF